MKRREFLTVTTSALLTGSAAFNTSHFVQAAPKSPITTGRARTPNIIFVLSDDLGYGELGCYGQKQIATPQIDRLAADGTRFTQCYAASTVCAPSRASLLTGYHSGHASIRGNGRRPLPAHDYTVAEFLKGTGYATAVVGKWGMGEPGTVGSAVRQGFDEFYGYSNHTQAHNNFPEFLWHNEDKVWLADNYSNKKGIYSNDLFTREAINFVRTNKNKPFFLYLNYSIPHANSTGKSIEAPIIEPEYVNRPWSDLEKRYASAITRMDRQIGQIRNELAALGLSDDTLIFFTSDNGPHKEGGHDPEFFDSNSSLRGIKRDLYEGGIRVPMIVSWPGRIKARAVSDQVWAFWDVLPTIAEFAGQPAPAGIDGISMVPALTGKPQRNHEYLYWEFHERGFEQAVRMGDWKAVRHGTQKSLELYDLKTDLAEKNNVAAQHPAVVAKIEEILKTARTESTAFPIREGTRRSGGTN